MKNSILVAGTVLCLLNVSLVTSANAADSSTEAGGASTASVASSISKKLTMGYVGLYTGGPLSGLGDSYSPDANGQPDPTTPQQMENFLGVFYKLSDTVKFGPQAHFFYSPVAHRNITMKDPLLQISNSAIVSSGGFKLAGYARAYLPATAESIDSGRVMQVRFMLNPSYDVPKTRLSVGAYAYAQPAFYNSTGKGTTFTGYLGPSLNYQVTPKLAITALYEMAATHKKGQDGTLSFNNAGTDFEPGLNYDITPNLSINPYLNIYTGNKVSMESTSMNLLIVGKLL